MKKFLTVIILLILALILGLGYLGFVPGVSDVMGSTKPRDLGVTYTEADLKSADAKRPIKLAVLPPGTPPEQSIRFSGQTQINAHFTSQEIMAMAAARKWNYWPLRDIQVRVNPDNTVESSGMIIVDRVTGYAAAVGVSPDAARKGMEYLRLNRDMPYYVKGSMEINNNDVSLDVQAFEIGRLPFPEATIKQYTPMVEEFLEGQIRYKITGADIKKLKAENGGITLVGKIPAVELRTVAE